MSFIHAFVVVFMLFSILLIVLKLHTFSSFFCIFLHTYEERFFSFSFTPTTYFFFQAHFSFVSCLNSMGFRMIWAHNYLLDLICFICVASDRGWLPLSQLACFGPGWSKCWFAEETDDLANCAERTVIMACGKFAFFLGIATTSSHHVILLSVSRSDSATLKPTWIAFTLHNRHRVIYFDKAII